MFVERNGVWTDAAWHDTVPVVSIAPFSQAYFELVRALPELAPSLSLGEQVLVSGRRTAIRFTAGGLTTLTQQRLSATVKDFRGQ